MARIFPFRGLRYNPEKIKPAEVVTQPYDKITPEMRTVITLPALITWCVSFWANHRRVTTSARVCTPELQLIWSNGSRMAS